MRSADRRRQLLQVAADLFARLGYRGTTTKALADAAGITEPILYRHFDDKLDLFVNLVEASEQAGALESLLDKIATYKEKTEALKKKIKKALFYPTAVLAVAIIVTTILLVFVIPQFEALFKGFGADLPAFTQMVINMSRFVQDQGWWLAILTGGAIYAFIEAKKRSRAMREAIDRMSLKLPVVGPILVKAAIARVLGTTWQRCRVQWMRNALAHIGKAQQSM